MARTIQEIDLPRQRIGGCELTGRILVEEPVGAPHDAIIAAEAASIAREIEQAITSVIQSRSPKPTATSDGYITGAVAGLDGLGLLKR